jgi:hypothetical protein
MDDFRAKTDKTSIGDEDLAGASHANGGAPVGTPPSIDYLGETTGR